MVDFIMENGDLTMKNDENCGCSQGKMWDLSA
jgi:hypothetical protein